MTHVVRRHLFLLFGLLTLALFLLLDIAGRLGYTDLALAIAAPVRILSIPMYLVWLVLVMAQVAIVGHAAPPFPLAVVITAVQITAGFLPYVLADYALDRLVCTRNLRQQTRLSSSEAEQSSGQS